MSALVGVAQAEQGGGGRLAATWTAIAAAHAAVAEVRTASARLAQLTRRPVGLHCGDRCVVTDGCVLASGNNSVVECDLAKVEVAGSNPVSRSNSSPSSVPSHASAGRRQPARTSRLLASAVRAAWRSLARSSSSRRLSRRRRRQVVRQRSAKPPSPVQIRAAPPNFLSNLRRFRIRRASPAAVPDCP